MSPQPLKGKRLTDIKFKPRLFGGATINARTIVAPLVAFTMAGLLYVYTRTSIQAAKRNARSHRIADGGQISWYNESQRRHGALGRPEEPSSLLYFGGNKGYKSGKVNEQDGQMTKEDARLRGKKIRHRDTDG